MRGRRRSGIGNSQFEILVARWRAQSPQSRLKAHYWKVRLPKIRARCVQRATPPSLFPAQLLSERDQWSPLTLHECAKQNLQSAIRNLKLLPSRCGNEELQVVHQLLEKFERH